jgi:PAS domain-containing protein
VTGFRHQQDGWLRLALEDARIGTWERDLVADAACWSARMAELYGRPPGMPPLSHDAWLARIHPEDRALALRGWPRPGGGWDHEAEFRVVWPDGTVRRLAERGWVVETGATGQALRVPA